MTFVAMLKKPTNRLLREYERRSGTGPIFVGPGHALVITVAAVVVTRNRPALLKRCLAAIDSQTFPASQLVVVDNASDERTRELLAIEAARRGDSFHSIRLEENTGGAGGFHAGMRACLTLPCTHMWLMDDDCEPDSEAVAELVVAAAIVGEDAVLGGNIVDLNGESVNVQPVSQRLGTNCAPQYPLHLADGLLEMCTLTFVSFLVSVDLVRKVGLPLKEFFIWGDDAEYSCRLARFTKLYQVGKSKTKHLKSGDASHHRPPAFASEASGLDKQVYCAQAQGNLLDTIAGHNGSFLPATSSALVRHSDPQMQQDELSN